MPTEYILLKASDGALFALAGAIARQQTSQPLDFAGLAQRLCGKEHGEREVDIAQMSEVLADLRELVAADPKAVLEVLAGKTGG